MEELRVDGASGLATDERDFVYFRNRGIAYIPRAPEHKFAHNDSRRALLRDTVHKKVVAAKRAPPCKGVVGGPCP